MSVLAKSLYITLLSEFGPVLKLQKLYEKSGKCTYLLHGAGYYLKS
jgi:hypothetical protein